jgi:hypothetical protein
LYEYRYIHSFVKLLIHSTDIIFLMNKRETTTIATFATKALVIIAAVAVGLFSTNAALAQGNQTMAGGGSNATAGGGGSSSSGNTTSAASGGNMTSSGNATK